MEFVKKSVDSAYSIVYDEFKLIYRDGAKEIHTVFTYFFIGVFCRGLLFFVAKICLKKKGMVICHHLWEK